MSFYDQLSSAARAAQGIIAEMQGQATGDLGNFIGPDGLPYTMVFRSATAIENQSVASEMTQHGYNDRFLLVATATRDQFTAPPSNWRRGKGTRTVPAPALDCTIASVGVDDPLCYSFTLLCRQPPTVGV